MEERRRTPDTGEQPVRETSSDRKKQTARKNKKRPSRSIKEPLWERIVLAIIRFFIDFCERFFATVRRTALCWADLFSGIPLLFSYLRRKKKKKKREKEKRKASDKEDPVRINTEAAIEKSERSLSKNREKEDRKKEKERRAEEKRRIKEAKRALKKKKRRLVRSKIPFIAVAALLFFEFSVLAAAGALYLVNTLKSGSKDLSLSLVIDREHTAATVVPAKVSISAEEKPCFDLTFAAKELGFLAFGNDKNVIYTLPNGQKLQISDGSNTVYIDGAPVSLNGTVRFYKDHAYVSVELLQRCVKGVSVNYDRENAKLTLLCAEKPAEISLVNGQIRRAENPSTD